MKKLKETVRLEDHLIRRATNPALKPNTSLNTITSNEKLYANSKPSLCTDKIKLRGNILVNKAVETPSKSFFFSKGTDCS